MKNLILLLILGMSTLSFSQQTIPSQQIETLDGNSVDSKEVITHDGPLILVLWATWNKPAVLQLNTLEDQYQDLQTKYGAKLIAVSMDDSRNKAKVAPFVRGKSWTYDIYLDPSGSFARSMGMKNTPQTFILNSKGEIVFTHNGFSPGDEKTIIDELAKVK